MPFCLMTSITGGMNKDGFGLYYSKLGNLLLRLTLKNASGRRGKLP